jgi:predicted Fe-Mo cluster-binding NifX family protein
MASIMLLRSVHEDVNMTIAIPIYGTRVLPRFGFARDMMLVTVEDGRIVAHKQIELLPQFDAPLAPMLAAEQVSVVICGGIHPRFQEMLREQGINVVWGVVGEWQEVVQAYLHGTLQSDPTLCLCRGARRGRRLRRGQQRRR